MGRNLYQNNRGFGLIEILVAVALLGIISVGVMDIVNTSVKSGRSAAQSQEINSINSRLTAALSNACGEILNASPPVVIPAVGSPQTLSQLVRVNPDTGDTTVLAAVGANVDGVIITSMVLQTMEPHPSPGAARMQLRLNYQKTGNVTGPTGTVIDEDAGTSVETLAPGIVEIWAQVNAANEIISCSAAGVGGGGSSPEDSCIMLGGEYAAGPPETCRFTALPVADVGQAPTYPGGGGTTGLYVQQGINSAGPITAAGALTASAGITTTSIVASGTVQVGQQMIVQGLTDLRAGLVVSGDTTTGNLQSNGNITASGTITATSDRRLKHNIKLIPDALQKVLQIRGVTFNWNDSVPSARKQMGVIAQDVEKVAPELIYPMENGVKTVAYQNMVGLLIEAIKQQQKEIDALKIEVKTLKSK